MMTSEMLLWGAQLHMSFAATEAIFSPIVGEGDKPTPTQLAAKVKRWLDKLSQESETVDEAMEKSSCNLLEVEVNTRTQKLLRPY